MLFQCYSCWTEWVFARWRLRTSLTDQLQHPLDCSSSTYVSDKRITFSIGVKNQAIFVYYRLCCRNLGVCADLFPTRRPAVAQPRFEVRRTLQDSTMDQEDVFRMGRERNNDVGTFQSKRPDFCAHRVVQSLLEAPVVPTLMLGLAPENLVIVSRCSFCIGQAIRRGKRYRVKCIYTFNLLLRIHAWNVETTI